MVAAAAEFRAGVMLFFSGRWPDVSDHIRYASAVDTALAAEAHGFDDVWVSEHHYLQRSNPTALALAAYLLGQTTRVRVATGVTLLPAHNPVHVAEQAALLDHLSGGRFDLGVGRGEATADYEVMSSVEHCERGMPEALDLLMQSFTSSVSADSDLYRFREVSPQPRPWTRPHPPVLVACEADATLALAASHGLPCMFFLTPRQDEAAIAARVAHHAARAAEHGHHGPWQHTILLYAQVADTDEEAADVLRGPLEQALRTSAAEYVWVRPSWRQHHDHVQHLEGVIAHHAIGSPATCVDRLTTIVERSGVDRLILVVESAVTPAATVANVQRLGREVLPSVRERLRAPRSESSRCSDRPARNASRPTPVAHREEKADQAVPFEQAGPQWAAQHPRRGGTALATGGFPDDVSDAQPSRRAPM
jgi:alkanesulfonate monooxygenase SsuD/methylene tetrahydromethanopterin reductase-like flavin-dependent oxidoreductase (luciferase family)